MRRPSRSLQPSLQLARVSSFRGGKQCLALATSGTRLPREPCPGTESLRSLEIPSLSALPTLSRIPPSRFSPLPFSFAFPFLSSRSFSSPLFSSLSFSFGRVERPSRPRPKEVVDRRRKEISRAISRLRRATTRARPRAYTRAHTGTRYPLTHRQCVPLSYQLIAGRSLSAWDVFSHGLHFARPPPCARPRVPARPVSAQRNARRCKLAGN